MIIRHSSSPDYCENSLSSSACVILSIIEANVYFIRSSLFVHRALELWTVIRTSAIISASPIYSSRPYCAHRACVHPAPFLETMPLTDSIHMDSPQSYAVRTRNIKGGPWLRVYRCVQYIYGCPCGTDTDTRFAFVKPFPSMVYVQQDTVCERSSWLDETKIDARPDIPSLQRRSIQRVLHPEGPGITLYVTLVARHT